MSLNCMAMLLTYSNHALCSVVCRLFVRVCVCVRMFLFVLCCCFFFFFSNLQLHLHVTANKNETQTLAHSMAIGKSFNNVLWMEKINFTLNHHHYALKLREKKILRIRISLSFFHFQTYNQHSIHIIYFNCHRKFTFPINYTEND